MDMSTNAIAARCCLAGFLGIFAAGPSRVAAASEDRATVLDYGLALGALQLRDDLLRPLRWIGGQGVLVVGLEVDTGQWLHRAGIELGAGILRDRYGDGGMVITQGAHYACLARLRADRRLRVLVGATYRYESIDAYYYDWDDSFLYWMTSHSIAPTAVLEMHPWHGRILRVSFELPVLGLLSRPDAERIYKVDPMPYVYHWPALTHRNPSWAGPTDLFAPTMTATYDRQFGPHFGMRFGLDVFFRRTSEPRPFYALAETVRVELRHVF
jgi:hypothetical protein